MPAPGISDRPCCPGDALAKGETRLLAGQISAWCEMRLQQWVRVDGWLHASDNGREQVLMLAEHVHAGALLLCDRGSLRFAFFDTRCARGIWWMRRDAHQASSQVRVIHCWLHGGTLAL
jgi:hypothetical protein